MTPRTPSMPDYPIEFVNRDNYLAAPVRSRYPQTDIPTNVGVFRDPEDLGCLADVLVPVRD